jgi:HD-GYP domain-containing protein (c-di-GMP phosphodiesterase class II)
MKLHARFTEDILGRISVFRDLAAVAGAHHERLDGSGYPKGLTAVELPREARILAVADVFDALTADRPYRAALPVAEALMTIDRSAGSALDAPCIDALHRALNRLEPAAA